MDNDNIKDLMAEFHKQQHDTERMWLQYRLSKGLEYIDRHFNLVLTPVSALSKFSIYLYPDYPREDHSIYIHFDIFTDHTRMVDLVGNGENSGYQNQGYGTLLVNLALQVMRTIVDNNIPVEGDVSNRGDEDIDTSGARRHHFWQSFGFKPAGPDSHNTTMVANLDELKILNRGSIEGILPTTLRLAEFYPPANRPVIQAQLEKTLRELDVRSFATADLPDANTIYQARTRSLNWTSRLAYLSILCTAGGLAALLYPLSATGWQWLTVATGLGLLTAPGFMTARLVKFVPWYRNAVQDNQGRLDGIQQIQQTIIDLEAAHDGFAWRLYEPLAHIDAGIRSEAFDAIAHSSRSRSSGNVPYQHYGELLAKLQEKVMQNYTRPAMPASAGSDFLFGDLSDGLDIKQLEGFALTLRPGQFTQQVNRLLKACTDNLLVITGGNTQLYEFPTLIDHLDDEICQIELYRDGEPHWNNPRLGIKLYVSEGVLDFRTTLCAWKSVRAQELVATLGELWRYNLVKQTFIQVDDEGRGRPHKRFMDNEPRAFLLAVFDLLNAHWISAADLKRYQDILTRQPQNRVV